MSPPAAVASSGVDRFRTVCRERVSLWVWDVVFFMQAP
jgi:hypothetical protein